jgi:hypothetical protein
LLREAAGLGHEWEGERVTLAEFLLARVADDAKWGRDRQHEDFRKHRLRVRRAHLAPDDPIRVLADCAGKQRIVEECDPERTDAAAGGSGLADRVLRELALPYADHPDYREEWRP